MVGNTPTPAIGTPTRSADYHSAATASDRR
jgi:hypothetical protein